MAMFWLVALGKLMSTLNRQLHVLAQQQRVGNDRLPPLTEALIEPIPQDYRLWLAGCAGLILLGASAWGVWTWLSETESHSVLVTQAAVGAAVAAGLAERRCSSGATIATLISKVSDACYAPGALLKWSRDC